MDMTDRDRFLGFESICWIRVIGIHLREGRILAALLIWLASMPVSFCDGQSVRCGTPHRLVALWLV